MIYEVAVPLILLVMMIAMGMELTLDDFRRVAVIPRPALVGLFGQMVLLPLAGLAFAQWPTFAPTIAMGVVIVTACPGGATSNLFSYLARGNIALSVTLTSLSSALCFLAIPFWIELGLDLFMHDGSGRAAALDLPVARMVVQLFVLTLMPIAIGMGIRARWPEFSLRIRGRLRRAMTLLMAVALAAILGSEWETVVRDLRVAAAAALLLVTTMLFVSYGIARAARLEQRDAFTISIEVGLQNGALATTVVVTLLGRPDLLVFPGTYAVLSFVPVTVWTLLMRRRADDSEVEAAA